MDFSRLKAALEGLTGEMLPGFSLCASVDQRPAFSVSAGFSDEENGIEAALDTRYSAYSMTKPISACVALMASEQGKLDLNAPVSAYLEEFTDYTLLIADERGKRVVKAPREPRVIELLSMSAGFGDNMALLGCAPTRQAVSCLRDQPLLFESGTRWLYGLCYEVLGAVLEEAYGLKLNEIFRCAVFEPCGMGDSCFLSEVKDYSLLAPVYRAAGAGYESAPLDLTYAPHPSYYSAGAGLVTTAADYRRFLDALMGGRLIGKKSLESMKTDRLSGATMRADFNWPQTRGYGYGLGLRAPLPGSGYTDWGWGGAAGAYCLMDFDKNASLCFFTNVLGADETKLYPLLRDLFTEALLA